MKLFNREDERARKERYKLNMIVFTITAAVALISIIIKSFFLEFSFFEYGAELITLGATIIFGVTILSIFLRFKRLDERLKAVLSKIGTALILAVYLSYIGMFAAMMIDILTRTTNTPFTFQYSFILFIGASGAISSICRVLMTKTISKNASNTDYRQYKKRTVKTTIIVAVSCIVGGLCLGIASYFLKSNVMLAIAIFALLLGVPISILSCFVMLRAKKIYDKETNDMDIDNNQE